MATISCEDCGLNRRGPSNTKYCHLCRLLRNVEYYTTKTLDCQECRANFMPVKRGDPWCGNCALGQTANRGSCTLCGEQDTYRIMASVAVCERCARDPAHRRQFIRGMRLKQATQREAVLQAANLEPAHA